MNDKLKALDDYVLREIDIMNNAASDKSKTVDDRIYCDGITTGLGMVADKLAQLFYVELGLGASRDR